MIIGIDLDNTIIDYRKSFWNTGLLTGAFNKQERALIHKNKDLIPSKDEIKKYLLSVDNGKYLWESLQGQVYGKYIENASIYPGVVNFILHCKRRKIKRDTDKMEWMEQRGLTSGEKRKYKKIKVRQRPTTTTTTKEKRTKRHVQRTLNQVNVLLLDRLHNVTNVVLIL